MFARSPESSCPVNSMVPATRRMRASCSGRWESFSSSDPGTEVAAWVTGGVLLVTVLVDLKVSVAAGIDEAVAQVVKHVGGEPAKHVDGGKPECSRKDRHRGAAPVTQQIARSEDEPVHAWPVRMSSVISPS